VGEKPLFVLIVLGYALHCFFKKETNSSNYISTSNMGNPMRIVKVCGFVALYTFFLLNFVFAENFIIIENEQPGVTDELLITLDPQKHIDYGFAYPLTFECSVSIENSAQAWARFSKSSEWEQVMEKDTSEFFNAQEMVRFDHEAQKAFVSVAFSSESDSIFLKIVENGNILPIQFQKICKYYDNRQTAVTLSADDMAGWSRSKFEKALRITRSYKLWVTGAINTNGAGSSTYNYIQTQLDSGYFEAGCHSRSHPSAKPYDNYEWEITGNRDDLIRYLSLPALYRYNGKEYVYCWIAPNGYVDATIDSIVGREKFLVNRLYKNDYFGFPDWNEETEYYHPVGVARAFDPPRERLGWGIGSDDIDDLNGAFDWAYDEGEVYHVMCHPNVVEWDRAYTRDHLDYISNRNDVWYVGLGHLFLYHYAEENYTTITTAIASSEKDIPVTFALSQNYPNPFNPKTTISYFLPQSEFVELDVYNVEGQKITTLVSGRQTTGKHSHVWDGSAYSSSVYIYRLSSGGQEQIRKMILVK